MHIMYRKRITEREIKKSTEIERKREIQRET